MAAIRPIEKISALLLENDYRNVHWIDPATIIVAHWVRMKCHYGCNEFGRNACCPPNTPPVEECRRFFDCYSRGILFHFEKQLEDAEQRHLWSREINRRLLELERKVFIAGYPKTFLLFMDSCSLCTECCELRSECKQPKSARPSPEALAVDVFSTVRQYGFPIQVLRDYSDTMNRYAFLLIE